MTGNKTVIREGNPVKSQLLDLLVIALSVFLLCGKTRVARNILFLGLVLVLYGIRSYTRIDDRQSDLTIFRSGVETSPLSARTNAFYGYKLGFRCRL